ncbi:MAG: hypothetical protein IJ800_07125, partial [Clostridia bacterium]|nr:hypothetical protein [Clostridia bacterium]
LTALVTWSVERLIAWLNTKIKDEKALGMLTAAVNVVQSAVKSTYQTYVQSLKEQNIFDGEAQRTALNAAVQQATNTLSEEAKNYIQTNYGDLTEWIKLQIESTLYDLKNKAE